MRNSVFTLLLLAFFIACQPQSQSSQAPKLGKIDLAVSGNEVAQPAFERGLLLLHSFEYQDAAEAFREAQAADPDFALAYWGEAMTHNHPLWQQQDYEEARDILARLAPTPEARQAKAQTELEKDLLQAVEVLYGEGDKVDRDQAYADYLGELKEKYPESQEIRAFYALSLLGAVPDGRDEVAYEQGARIAQGILEENPDHPGALHYLIHAYDDPGHAAQAIMAADRYAEVAPDASHALHMPSHIYVALGRWDDVVSSNEASYQASLNRMERKDLGYDARGYHAFHWLLYGYLQQGRREDAARCLREMVQYSEESPSRRARVHRVLLLGTYLVETRDWLGEFAEVPLDVADAGVTVQGMEGFIRGRQAYERGDEVALQATIDQLDSLHQAEEMNLSQQAIAVCGSVDRSAPTRTGLNQLKVMTQELRALRADLAGDLEEAEQWLQRAVQLEYETSYSYGPPDVIKPSAELYGEWLLAQGRHREAEVQFEQALQRTPGRRLVLQGLEQAQQGMAGL